MRAWHQYPAQQLIHADGSFLLTKQRNILIVHPDTLLSGTRVGESFFCTRKSVLSERVQAGLIPMSCSVALMHRVGFYLKLGCDSWYNGPWTLPKVSQGKHIFAQVYSLSCIWHCEIALCRSVSIVNWYFSSVFELIGHCRATLPETEESHIEYLCSLIPELSSWQRRFLFQPPNKEVACHYDDHIDNKVWYELTVW